MRIKSLLTAAALSSAALAPFAAVPTASAAGTVQLRVANFYTYSASANEPYTLCLDGISLASLDTGATSTPTDVTPGSHQLTVFYGAYPACDGSPDIDTTITIPTDPASTLALWWSSNGETPLTATVFADDLSCLPAGQSRVITRNLATFYSEGPISGIDYKNATTSFASNLASGNQQATEVAAGQYLDPKAFIAGTSDSLMSDTTLDATAGTVTVRTLFGGADGDTGSSTTHIPVDTCTPETTSTTVPATSTTTTVPPSTGATAATPVRATPTYTG